MRTLHLGAVAAVGIASLAFAVAPTPAPDTAPTTDTVPYMTEDLAGDANGLRQGLLVNEPVPATSTGPASVPHADILGARITSVYEEVVGADGLVDNVLTGIEFRTGIAAEPTATTNPLIHRFMGTTSGCEFWVQAYTGTGGSNAHGTADVRAFEGCGYALDPDAALGDSVTTTAGVAWSYDGEQGELVVTLTLDELDPTLAGNFERGAFYLLGSLHNRSVTNAVAVSATVPQFDDMPGDNGFTVLGSDIPADEEPADEDGSTGDGEDTGEGEGASEPTD